MVRLLVIVALCQWTITGRCDERIWLNARVNGKTTRLIFDSGASRLILFRKSAERLGLKITGPSADFKPAPGQVAMGMTEECELTLFGTGSKSRFGVVEVPNYVGMEMDGVVGWQPVRKNVFQIDAVEQTLRPLDAVPAEAKTWVELRVLKGADILTLEVRGAKRERMTILVDTGSDRGVSLQPKKWREWKAAHPDKPTTLNASYMPATGLVVSEEGWAKELSFGQLTVTDVPVTEANSAEAALARYEATFGLAALKRMDFIVDGRKGIAYLKPKKTPAPACEHNRLGAVFVPRDAESDDLVAHVVAGSPAEEAGIGNGDVLLKIADLDVTRWRTDPTVLPLSRFWQEPAGTRLRLTIRRGNGTVETTILLRNILPPSAD